MATVGSALNVGITNPLYTFTGGDRVSLCINNLDGANADAPLPLGVGTRIRWAMTRGTVADYTTSPIFEKSSDIVTEIEILDAPNGVILVHLYGVDTLGLFGDFYWELELIDADEEKVAVGWGPIQIRKNVQNTRFPTTFAP